MRTNQVIFLLTIVVVISSAILLGLLMYQHQAYVSNQRALTIDMNHCVSQVFVYLKTPPEGGGVGQNLALVSKKQLAEFMGFTFVSNADTKKEYYSIITENGEIRISYVHRNIVTLTGIGKYPQRGLLPMIQSTVNLYTYMVNSTLSSAKSF